MTEQIRRTCEQQAGSIQNTDNVNMTLNIDSEEAEKDKLSILETVPQGKHSSSKGGPPKKVPNIRCIICKKRFLDRSKLFRHVTLLHANVNILVCNICGKNFLFKRSFHLHLSAVHSKKSVKYRKRLIQKHLEGKKYSLHDSRNGKESKSYSHNDIAIPSKTSQADTDSNSEKCNPSNYTGASDSNKIKHLVHGKSLPRKRRRKYTQRARQDLCLPYFGLRTCNQYLNHRIKWKYCRRVSRKNKKWKNLKKPKECENEKENEGNEKAELTESNELLKKYTEERDSTSERQTVEQLSSITDFVTDLNMPTILVNENIESNNVRESNKVIKKYLPCKNKLKSHQDHSYGKISSMFLSMINDTNDTINNVFSENRNSVNHVKSTVNNLPEVSTISEHKDIVTKPNYLNEVNMAADNTEKRKSLINMLDGDQKVTIPTTNVITYPVNVSSKNHRWQKTNSKSPKLSNSSPESSNNNSKLKRKLKKILAVCSMCKEVYSLMHYLRIKQIATQNNGPAIDCPFCKINFSSLAHLETHITSTHLQCDGKMKGGKKFVVEIIHPDKPVNYQNNEELAFECHCCPKKFDAFEAFNSHITNCHTRVNSEVAKTTASTLTKIKEILSTEIVETIFGKDSDTIEDNLKQGATIKSNIQKEKVGIGNVTENLHFNFLIREENENNDVSTSSFEEDKVTERTPVKKDVLDKLICDLGIQSSVKQDTSCPFVCMICYKKFELEHEFILHTEVHVGVHDCRENYSKNHMRVTEKLDRKVGIIKQQRCRSQERPGEIRVRQPNFLFEPSHHTLSDRWSPTNLRVYTRKPKKVGLDSSINTNINNNDIHVESEKDSQKLGKTLSEADSTVSSDTNNDRLLKETKMSVKRKRNLCKYGFTKKTKEEFKTGVDVDEIEQSGENGDKLVTSTTKGSSCILCNRRFHSEKNYNEHMLADHNSSTHELIISQLPTPCTSKLNNKHLFNYTTSQKEEMSEGSKSDTRHIKVQTPLSVLQTKERLIKRTKVWQCRLCRINFQWIADLIRHKYYYHQDESVVHICENCTKVLTSVAMVNTHMCTNVTLWRCKRCNLKFSNGTLLKQHNTKHHYESVGPHVCSRCKKNFLTMSMLERHTLTTHSYEKLEFALLSAPETYRKVHDSAISSTDALVDQIAPGSSVCQAEYLISDEVPGLERTLWLHHLKKTSLEDCEVVTISRSTLSGKEQFKCNLCESIHHTKLGIKLHLIKLHKTSVDICSLCSKLYIAASIAQHLLSEHMTQEKTSTKNVDVGNDRKDESTTFVRVLGPKQLYSICEYRKLGSPMGNKCFKCTMCYREFLNFRFCRTHYFKIHDTVCVLCNTEFIDSRQATDHKLKVHGPVSSYLWAVQKIFSLILESKKYGATVQEVISLLSKRVSKLCSGTKSKKHRNLVENRRFTRSQHLRKTNGSCGGSRYTQTSNAPEENENSSKSHDNFYRIANYEKVYVDVHDISKQSANLNTHMTSVQIGEESEMEYTISADVLGTCSNVSEDNENGGNTFVLMVTEDDLKLYRNNIKELVSRLCLPKVFSEDYVTELLLNYVQQIGS